jgi:hypothetical protein
VLTWKKIKRITIKIEKNIKDQFSINQILKDKIEKKKNFNHTKGLIKIKRITIKIEIQNKFYIWLKCENEIKKSI